MQEEVGTKQADTAADLAKAEPAVKAAMAALDTLNEKDIGMCKTMGTPPPGVGEVFSSTMVLLAGISKGVPVQKNGKVKDVSWGAAKKCLMGDIKGYIADLISVKDVVDSSSFPEVNRAQIQQYLDMETFDVDIITGKVRHY